MFAVEVYSWARGREKVEEWNEFSTTSSILEQYEQGEVISGGAGTEF